MDRNRSPKIYSEKLTAEENAVLERYESITGMEPCSIEDFEAGHISKKDLWRHQVAWIEGVCAEVVNMGFPIEWDADGNPL